MRRSKERSVAVVRWSSAPRATTRWCGSRGTFIGSRSSTEGAYGEGVPTNPLQATARQPTCYRLLMQRRALLTRTERALRRMSKDRIGVLDLVGLPSIQVTVSGRKTGIPRTTPLQYVPDGDAFLVVGSNWGSGKHPAWSANLMGAHQVTVRRRDEQFTAAVRMLPESSENRPGTRPSGSGPITRSHRILAGGREFRLFTLERIASDPGE